jgi:hypothetical protein
VEVELERQSSNDTRVFTHLDICRRLEQKHWIEDGNDPLQPPTEGRLVILVLLQSEGTNTTSS